jgi:hypothetical protein
MNSKKQLPTIKPTPLRGKLKTMEIRAAVKAVKAARLAREKKEAGESK